MPLLSDEDVRRAFGFLHAAAEIDGPDAFTAPVLEAFWELIPSDAGCWEERSGHGSRPVSVIDPTRI